MKLNNKIMHITLNDEFVPSLWVSKVVYKFEVFSEKTKLRGSLKYSISNSNGNYFALLVTTIETKLCIFNFKFEYRSSKPNFNRST